MSIFLPKAMIKKSCNISKPAVNLTSPSEVQRTMDEAAACVSNAWEGSDPFGARLHREVWISEPTCVQPQAPQSSWHPRLQWEKKDSPVYYIYKKGCWRACWKSCFQRCHVWLPWEAGWNSVEEGLHGRGEKGYLLGMSLYSPTTLDHTGCCGHFCLCWLFSQEVNLCIALYVLWYSRDLLREKTDMKKTSGCLFLYFCIPLASGRVSSTCT